MKPARVIGKRIKDRREALGQTQTWLAEEVGVTQTTVSRWESGKDCPSRHHEPAIVRALRAEGLGLFELVAA